MGRNRHRKRFSRPRRPLVARASLTGTPGPPIVAGVSAAPTYHYRPTILEALLEHGLSPRPSTDPQFLRDAINELYRFEIRKLRDRVLAGELPRGDLAGQVVELRKRYVLLSIPMAQWTS
jgi:hypothetical protein